jgi:hypothetical protein
MSHYLIRKIPSIAFVALLSISLSVGGWNFIFSRFESFWGEFFAWVVLLLRLYTALILAQIVMVAMGLQNSSTNGYFISSLLQIAIYSLSAILSVLFVHYTNSLIGIVIELAIPIGLSALLNDLLKEGV